jgi:penicillin-binding protein 1C
MFGFLVILQCWSTSRNTIKSCLRRDNVASLQKQQQNIMSSSIRHNRFKLILLVSISLTVAFIATLFVPLPKEDFSKQSVHSLRVFDRNGILLREFLNDEEGHGQWKPLVQVAPELINATIAVEDRRYWHHPGVDPLAIVRAAYENIKAGVMRVGGSTITQQVIRNIYRRPRTLVSKAAEAWQALRLERMMTKREILEQYLNRAPYGNQLTGIEAASRYYFQKPASGLSLAEAAFLAGLPNAPTSLNPYQNIDATLQRQKIVLRRLLHQKLVTRDEYDRAILQPVRLTPPEVNFRAPHAVQMAEEQFHGRPDVASITLTIDYPLQQNIQWAVRSHLAQLKRKNVTNAAVVVIENRTGEVRALLGSANFFDEKTEGQVNGATALRQPGSSIKPFMYVRALEGSFTPATVLPDLPTHIPDDRGDYIPENYDKRYHGPVRLRTALACSYNVPAVRTIQVVGIGTLYQSMQMVGITSLTQPVEYYGYGLTLGNAEVSLLELTNAYRTFANLGVWKPSRLIQSAVSIEGNREITLDDVREHENPRQVYDERAAYLITDILKDFVARRPAFGNAFHFPFECAVKTGTTKDYRDNWTLGYTTEYTVSVWAGNFDASPMHGVSGVTGAGQIFYDVMMLVHEHSMPEDFSVLDGLVQVSVCPVSGFLPNQNCGSTIKELFVRGKEPTARCKVHQAFRVTTESGTTQKRVYEILSPEYRSWADEERIPTPPPGAVAIATIEKQTQVLNSQSTIGNRHSAIRDPQFSILSPLPGDIFKIDPILRPEYQTVKVLGVIPEQFSDVKLVVNKKERLPFDPTGTWWTLKKGTQRLQLEARDKNRVVVSRSITIEVE